MLGKRGAREAAGTFACVYAVITSSSCAAQQIDFRKSHFYIKLGVAQAAVGSWGPSPAPAAQHVDKPVLSLQFLGSLLRAAAQLS